MLKRLNSMYKRQGLCLLEEQHLEEQAEKEERKRKEELVLQEQMRAQQALLIKQTLYNQDSVHTGSPQDTCYLPDGGSSCNGIEFKPHTVPGSQERPALWVGWTTVKPQ
ncbi:uncharacterized protein LOC143026106 [Oratosquilla oratoria]|uniref:uncharacterized protein LOC143026106 n=1 Tax=Oratosquilla oratoria TaxID=337810 RepID=UPI003F769A52